MDASNAARNYNRESKELNWLLHFFYVIKIESIHMLAKVNIMNTNQDAVTGEESLNVNLIADVLSVWGDIRHFIIAALKYNGGRSNENDCLKEILSGERQLWVVDGNLGVVVTGIMLFPQKTCGIIDICTGVEFNRWAHLVAKVENWMKLQGCDQAFFVARPGMEKLLKANGYDKTHAFFEKELTDG